MQYIQFQSQIATQVPTPSAGEVNVFVDVADNSIKSKDENGNINGGTGNFSIITVSKSAMDVLIANGDLTAGQFYKITSVNPTLFGGTDIILQANSTASVDKQGLGLFYNPKYADTTTTASTGYFVWSNATQIAISGTTGYFSFNEPIIGDQGQTGTLIAVPGNSTMSFVSFSGDWTTTTRITGQSSNAATTYVGLISAATYTAGQKVIWGGSVWTNLTGQVGSVSDANPPFSAPYLDNTNWSLVSYNSTDYTVTCDTIEYEYESDNISYRKDNNSEVRSNFNWFTNAGSYNAISRFPWGHPYVANFHLLNATLDNLVNFPNQLPGYVKNVSVDNGGAFNASAWGWGSQISGITIGKNAQLVGMVLGNGAILDNISLEDSATGSTIQVSNNDNAISQFTDIRIGLNSSLDNLSLLPDSYVENVDLGVGCRMTSNILNNNSYFHNVILRSNAFFGNITLYSASSIYFITVGANSNFKNITGGTTHSTIYDVESGSEGYFGDITFAGSFCEISYIGLKTNAYLQNVSMGDFSTVKYIDAGITAGAAQIVLGSNSQLNYIGIANNSNINDLTIGNSTLLNYFQMGVNSQINSVMVESGFTLTNIKLDVGTSLSSLDFDSDISNAYLGLDSSTFPATVDITSATTIDLSAYNYAGLITLTSSNSAENVDTILSGPNFPQRLSPESGLTVVFLGTVVSAATSNGAIIMPNTTYVTHGSKFDYITLDIVVKDNLYLLSRQVGGQNYL